MSPVQPQLRLLLLLQPTQRLVSWQAARPFSRKPICSVIKLLHSIISLSIKQVFFFCPRNCHLNGLHLNSLKIGMAEQTFAVFSSLEKHIVSPVLRPPEHLLAHPPTSHLAWYQVAFLSLQKQTCCVIKLQPSTISLLTRYLYINFSSLH